MIKRIIQLFILLTILLCVGILWFGFRQSTPIIEPTISRTLSLSDNAGIHKDFFSIPSALGGEIDACLVSLKSLENISPRQNRVRDILKMRNKLPLVGEQSHLVLICTTWDQGMASSMSLAEGLSAAGYTCLIWSPRARDRQDEVYCTYGLNESVDVTRLIDAALARLGQNKPVVGIGQSFGSSVLLNAASHDERIRSVVSLDGMSSLKSAAMEELEEKYGKPASFGAFWLIDFWVQMRAGFSCFEVAPIEDAMKLKIPVMVVHTNEHYFSDIEDCINLYECVNNEGKALYSSLREGEPFGLKEREFMHVVEGKKGERYERHYQIQIFDGDDELQAFMAEWIYENTKMPMPKVLDVEPTPSN